MKPEDDIAAYINEQMETGEAESDPFSYAATVMRVTLEWVLDDGISGSMNDDEFRSMELLAHLLTHVTDQEVDPRAG